MWNKIKEKGAQELFDGTLRKLRKQNKRSVHEFMRLRHCLYRGDDGCGCAVGVNLTDKEYDRAMEGLDVSSLKLRKLLPTRLVPFTSLLSQMQFAHDNGKYANVALSECREFAEAFAKVAIDFQLDTSVLVAEFPLAREALAARGH